MNLNIIYEDTQVIAVNKPAGMLAQGDRSGALSLLDYTREHVRRRYGKPGNVFLGLVHRLDRPVSGVMLFARTSKAARRLQRQFADRRTIKLYAAMVESRLPVAPESWTRCETFLARKGDITVTAGTADNNAVAAGMEYAVLESRDGRSLLLIRLFTGRKHQIRAQLSSLGMPVIGDVKYGARESFRDGSICLHAAYLGADHPNGRARLELAAPLPSRMARMMGDEDAVRAAFDAVLFSRAEHETASPRS